MTEEITAEVVRATRAKYGLSQRSFSVLLGIGEATIVRYEKGATPTRANANLIRAADDPRFMAGCLERAGNAIPARQRQRIGEYIYELVSLRHDDAADAREGRPATDAAKSATDAAYARTLRQEILNGRAAALICDIIERQAEASTPEEGGIQYEILLTGVSRIKARILDSKSVEGPSFDRISGYLDCVEDILRDGDMKLAS